MPDLDKLPRVRQVEGIDLVRGETIDLTVVVLQYIDHKGTRRELDIPLKHALYLMAMLQAMRIENKIPFPDDPFEVLRGGPPT